MYLFILFENLNGIINSNISYNNFSIVSFFFYLYKILHLPVGYYKNKNGIIMPKKIIRIASQHHLAYYLDILLYKNDFIHSTKGKGT